MPSALPGYSGGQLSGRSKEEVGNEEEEEEGQKKKMENEVMNEISANVPREADAAGCGVTQKAVPVAQGTNAGGIVSVNPGSGSGRRIGWKESHRAGNRSGTAPKPKTSSKKEM